MLSGLVSLYTYYPLVFPDCGDVGMPNLTRLYLIFAFFPARTVYDPSRRDLRYDGRAGCLP